MKSFVLFAITALLAPVLAGDGPGCGPADPTITPPPGTTAPPNPGCPTITSTTSVCSTCMQLMCLQYTSVTNKCGCPAPIPTVYKKVPCGNPADCPASCFTSSIAVQPPCPTTKPPPTTTKKPTSVVCTSTGTQKVYGSNCAIKCPKEPICIADAAVELPCGCDRVSVTVTTQTVCATASPCPILCSTGFGFITITPTNCPTATVRPTATLH